MPDYSNGPIHVALAFDTNFWAPAYATMRSVCLFTKRRKDLVFHLCHRPLPEDQIADLREIEDEFGATVHFYDITQSVSFNEKIASLPVEQRLTNIIYTRLLFDELLPADIDRLIYLDSDMMMLAPIERLWQSKIGGKTLAAVPENWGTFIATGRDFRQNRDLFDPANPYFNSGLLLIDMYRWREAKVAAKIEEFKSKGIVDRIYYDQDFLNILFSDDFHKLDAKWNVIGPAFAHEGLEVFNLHYVGYSKPWNLLSNVAFHRMYRHVMTNRIFYKFFRHRLKRRVLRLLPFMRRP